MNPLSGACLCGQVRLRILTEPLGSRICWCRDCQRLAAGHGTVNALFPSQAIEVTGTLAHYDKTADSGNRVTRRFCPHCGTQMLSESSGRPGVTVVRAGVLDEPSGVTPTAHIWTASAPAWACLDPALEKFEGPPPAPAASTR